MTERHVELIHLRQTLEDPMGRLGAAACRRPVEDLVVQELHQHSESKISHVLEEPFSETRQPNRIPR